MTQQSTWFMRDGAFLRLKTVELGYSIPPAVLRRYNIDRIRIYASGVNLLSFSKFKMWMLKWGQRPRLSRPAGHNAGAQVSF